MDQNPNENIISEVTNKEYEYGFVTDIETDFVPKGLNEDIIRLISKKKEEPEWLLEFRLKAFRHWQTLKQPNWAHLDIPEINAQLGTSRYPRNQLPGHHLLRSAAQTPAEAEPRRSGPRAVGHFRQTRHLTR